MLTKIPLATTSAYCCICWCGRRAGLCLDPSKEHKGAQEVFILSFQHCATCCLHVWCGCVKTLYYQQIIRDSILRFAWLHQSNSNGLLTRKVTLVPTSGISEFSRPLKSTYTNVASRSPVLGHDKGVIHMAIRMSASVTAALDLLSQRAYLL